MEVSVLDSWSPSASITWVRLTSSKGSLICSVIATMMVVRLTGLLLILGTSCHGFRASLTISGSLSSFPLVEHRSVSFLVHGSNLSSAQVFSIRRTTAIVLSILSIGSASRLGPIHLTFVLHRVIPWINSLLFPLSLVIRVIDLNCATSSSDEVTWRVAAVIFIWRVFIVSIGRLLASSGLLFAYLLSFSILFLSRDPWLQLRIKLIVVLTVSVRLRLWSIATVLVILAFVALRVRCKRLLLLGNVLLLLVQRLVTFVLLCNCFRTLYSLRRGLLWDSWRWLLNHVDCSIATDFLTFLSMLVSSVSRVVRTLQELCTLLRVVRWV